MNILPEHIFLPANNQECHFSLPPIMSRERRESDSSPADIVQAVAIYHLIKRGHAGYTDIVYRLSGVEIRDTRLETAKRAIAALQAETARLRAAVEAGDGYIKILESLLDEDGREIISREAWGYGRERQAYARTREGGET